MNLENKKQMAIIALAVGLGLMAAVLTGNHIQESIKQETARLSQEYETKKIAPLVSEIDSLRKEMQKLAAQQQQIAAQKPSEAVKTETPSVPKSSLALRTPAGKRAYTINLDSLSAVGGLINPGDYVDIIGHLDMPDPVNSKTENITAMVFQNILLLAVGTNLQEPGGYETQMASGALKVTLALSPEECSLMSFIQKHGRMQFILRAPSETETQMMQAASWSSLADYVFEKQGTELVIPRGKVNLEPVKTEGKEEVKPFIQIFRGGREL
ncbi:MAG: Flp pilus assembly protein CpaB [Candidatus Omnitrophota bacterium]|nr:Flp pilus assembly protein CpaB [Candidatus Omnitrophota bacterium]MDZ4241210.1 Flp pilus assembly protein CpaB [Candidatus Omnitrophota bacterium]